jgi:hypothetical protein
VAVPNFTFTLTPTLVTDELKLWEKNGLRFNRRPQHDVEWEVRPDHLSPSPASVAVQLCRICLVECRFGVAA